MPLRWVVEKWHRKAVEKGDQAAQERARFLHRHAGKLTLAPVVLLFVLWLYASGDLR